MGLILILKKRCGEVWLNRADHLLLLSRKHLLMMAKETLKSLKAVKRDKEISEEKVLILTRKVLRPKRDPTLLILQPLTKDRHKS